MPGCYECPKCGFVLSRSILYTQTGNVSADTPSIEECPNDGELMIPVTYKSAYATMAKTCESQILRAVKAEDEVARLNKVVAEYRRAMGA